METAIISVPTLSNKENIVNGSISSALILKAYKDALFLPKNASKGDVVKAIEKQIPKKPIITKFGNGAELINCGECFMCSHITRAVDYCPHCGQRICWTEDTENDNT